MKADIEEYLLSLFEKNRHILIRNLMWSGVDQEKELTAGLDLAVFLSCIKAAFQEKKPAEITIIALPLNGHKFGVYVILHKLVIPREYSK